MKSLYEKDQYYTMKQMDPIRDEIPVGSGPGCQYYTKLRVMADVVFQYIKT